VTRDDWLDQFIDELLKIRPHTGHRLAKTLALHQYNGAEHPREKARQYDKAQRGESVPAKAKRTKG
jgi:hypothetical protein